MNEVPQASVAVMVPVLAGSTDASQEIVILGGHVYNGGVLSTTVINCVPVEILLQASLADQVRTMVPVPLHPVKPKTLSAKAMIRLLTDVQLSIASAVPVA